jgi:hypothetical protein
VSEFKFTPATDSQPPASALDAATVVTTDTPSADSETAKADPPKVVKRQPKRTDKYKPFVW